MNILKAVVFALLASTAFQASATRCGSNYNLTHDITIDAGHLNTAISTQGAGALTVVIEKHIIVKSGSQLTITGAPGSRLKVRFHPAVGIVVEPGGLVIIEHCNLESYGHCSTLNSSTNTTWDGIVVYGDPNKDHYEYYDLTNGWNPYAEIFVPGGAYRKTASGDQAHGRLQMRWCSLKDIQLDADPSPSASDDPSTEYLNEAAYGNYAVRSSQGGILNIIDCNFSEVRTAVLIDNYTQYSTADPHSKFMNAFQIVDCDFRVSNIQRSSNDDFLQEHYRYCIELHNALKATVEGCHFISDSTETQANERGTAIFMDRSSLLMHKSGNFRRSIDFVNEDQKGCPLYGNEQNNLSDYPASHPWKTNTPRQCEFETFYRAIDFEGADGNKYILALDDVVFEHNFFGILLRDASEASISRCRFSFDEAESKFTVASSGNGMQFPRSQGVDYLNVDQYDRFDLVAFSSKNCIITDCEFSSNYNGTANRPGKTIHTAIIKQKNGVYNDNTSKYVYDLVYKCIFNDASTTNGQDYGVYVAQPASANSDNSFTLVNCCKFTDLARGIVIGQAATQLKPQFHYSDMTTGRNAPCKNQFYSNACDLWISSNFLGNPVEYYHEVSGTLPSVCTNSSYLNPSPSTEAVACSSMDCTSFPMTHLFKTREKPHSTMIITPSPAVSGKSITFAFNHPKKGDGELHIVNQMGQEIISQSVSSDQKSIDMMVPLPAGVFIAVFQAGDISARQTFLITQ